MTDVSEIRHWARSGAMILSGYADEEPRIAPGRPASFVREHLAKLRESAPRWGGTFTAPVDERLLGERAAFRPSHRNAPHSVGEAMRIFPTTDGWVALSLARDSDHALVSALVSGDSGADWREVELYLAATTANAAVERGRLLGLPIAAVGQARPQLPVITAGGPRVATDAPLIVDFSALWAGPLCAQLLGSAGARIVKVESVHRLDGARRGASGFYNLLHAGHESVAIDPHDPADRRALVRLVRSADVVIEASRPHALRAWGLHAEDFVADGTIWLSLTAYGRDVSAVGFGDDVAAAAGLVLSGRGSERIPVGDALADPLSGVALAAVASDLLSHGRGALVDLSMSGIAATARADGTTAPHHVLRHGDGWLVDDGTTAWAVSAPHARQAPRVPAPPAGAHTQNWLRS